MLIKRAAFTAFICIFSGLSLTAQADQMATIQALLRSFGGSCTIQGTQSRRLDEAAQNMASALTAMQSSPECAGLGTIASGVRGSVDEMAYLAPKYSSEEMQYQNLRERKSALVAAIAVETDPSISFGLRTQLRDTEVNIAEAKQTWSLEKINERNDKLLSAARSYRSATDALLRGLVDNTKCMDNHPRVAQEFGQIGLALAQSSTLGMTTGGASILAGAGIYTAARLTQFIKEKHNSNALKRFSDPALASSLSCALEALNEIYCDSEKTEKLGRFILSPEMDITRNGAHSAFSGLELLEKAVPSLDNSLTLMKIGSDPSSANDAMSRMGITTLKVMLQSTKGTLAGILNDLKKAVGAIDPQTEPVMKRKQIFKAQKEFVSNFMNFVMVPDDASGTTVISGSSGSSDGILAYIYKGQKARYYLMGFDPVKINISEPGFIKFSDLEIEGSYPEGKDPWKQYGKSDTHFEEKIELFQVQVQGRFNSWYNEAQSVLDAQANLILKTDKKDILASFDRPISRDYKITPMIAMQKLVEFITNPKNQAFLTPKDRRIANEVALVIETEVVARINSIAFDLPEAEFQAKANEIFRLVLSSTRYDDDTRFFMNRLNGLINTVVTEASIELYKNGSPEMVYALASADVVKELKSFAASSKSTVDMIYDANKTKGQVPDLIGAFVRGFAHPLKRALEELNLPENRVRRAVDRGHLCLQLLGLHQDVDRKFFEKVVLPNCEGAELPPLPRMPLAPKVTRELFLKPLEERICTHQNWRRKLMIFEKGGD